MLQWKSLFHIQESSGFILNILPKAYIYTLLKKKQNNCGVFFLFFLLHPTAQAISSYCCSQVLNKKGYRWYWPLLSKPIIFRKNIPTGKPKVILRGDVFLKNLHLPPFPDSIMAKYLSFPRISHLLLDSYTYRVFRKNCVFSQFTATPPSL